MKKNEIKKMVEQVVGVEFVAEDGTIFYNEAECREYEESALFAVSKKCFNVIKIKRVNATFALDKFN